MIKKSQVVVWVFLLIVVVTSLISIILFHLDKEIITFLSQFETSKTLLQYSDFWNERVHDWLGDAITLVGVMLAFSLPFTAQVVQWVVATYGVTTFPEIAKDELQISHLLLKMFLFVGLVIFWRLFIYDISPYTSSLYILFNFVVAICFIWILWRLFKVVRYVLKCTFEFRSFIIAPAYEYIKGITESIPEPYYEIKDPTIIPSLSSKYLQSMELLRDDETTGFKRGNILNTNTEGFEKYTWEYILASFATNDIEKIGQAIVLQGELSSHIKAMSIVFGKEYYTRYMHLASGLTYYIFTNRYYFYDERLEQKNISIYDDFQIQELYKKELKKVENFMNYYSDVLFLAEEIEGKNNRDYYPILSCQYLLNHSSFSYLYFIPKNLDIDFDWNSVFDRIDHWEKDTIEITKRLIKISSKYKKTSALLDVYHNLRNDLQYSHQREIYLYNLEKQDLKPEEYSIVNERASQFRNISTPAKVTLCLDFLLSDEFNQYFNIDNKQRNELLLSLLRIRYKLKVDELLLFWLGSLSFDASIVIKILEEANPIDQPRIIDVGEHLIPLNIEEALRKYLIIYDNDFRTFNPFENLDKYQIVFSTMVFYFLLRTIKRNIANAEPRPFDIAKNIYKYPEFSIRNIKSIKGIAKLWRESPKGIESNKAIQNLCLNYGMNFEDLKNFYIEFLTCLEDQADGVIQNKILVASLDEEAISEFTTTLHKSAEELLRNNQFKVEIAQDLNKKRLSYRFMSIEREWFIKADTGVHYVRDSLDQRFFLKCQHYLTHNQNKKMIVFNGDKPEITFNHKAIGNKLCFYCEYNFYFE